ncbi:MAG TPA: hypothetical protein DCL54_09770 [Alphaproteobacteria bacterium]|nr:hypothetical protein [Alphaproteobacteria bacterium]HAJ46853.1 hypothetical protein [Alphaproteobacteria bacterium]
MGLELGRCCGGIIVGQRWISFGVGFACLLVAGAAAPTASGNDRPPQFRCLVREVAVKEETIMVTCHNWSMNGLRRFAADTKQPYSSVVAAEATTALRENIPMLIAYVPDPEINPVGCRIRDCRKILAVIK